MLIIRGIFVCMLLMVWGISVVSGGFDRLEKWLGKKLPAAVLFGGNIEGEEEIILEHLEVQKYRVLWGDSVTVEDLSGCLETFNLFDVEKESCIVILKAEGLSKKTLSYLFQYVQNPSPHANLYMFTSKKQFFESFISNKLVKISLFGEWLSEKSKRLAKTLHKKAEHYGVSCSPSTMQFFLNYCAHLDCQGVIKEFDKLCCALGDKKTLEQGDIVLFIDKEEKVSLWSFRDAILQSSREVAVRSFATLRDRGEEPLGLIAFLRSQLTLGLRSLEDGGMPLDKKDAIFQKYGRERLLQGFSYLFYAEGQIKEGADPSIVMTTLIIRMTQ